MERSSSASGSPASCSASRSASRSASATAPTPWQGASTRRNRGPGAWKGQPARWPPPLPRSGFGTRHQSHQQAERPSSGPSATARQQEPATAGRSTVEQPQQRRAGQRPAWDRFVTSRPNSTLHKMQRHLDAARPELAQYAAELAAIMAAAQPPPPAAPVSSTTPYGMEAGRFTLMAPELPAPRTAAYDVPILRPRAAAGAAAAEVPGLLCL
jgi:hypothetical protein